ERARTEAHVRGTRARLKIEIRARRKVNRKVLVGLIQTARWTLIPIDRAVVLERVDLISGRVVEPLIEIEVVASDARVLHDAVVGRIVGADASQRAADKVFWTIESEAGFIAGGLRRIEHLGAAIGAVRDVTKEILVVGVLRAERAHVVVDARQIRGNALILVPMRAIGARDVKRLSRVGAAVAVGIEEAEMRRALRALKGIAGTRRRNERR